MKLKPLLFHNFIILVLIAICFSRSYSQANNFIRQVSENEIYRNKSIENYESRTRHNPNVKLRTYVRIGKLTEVLKGNQLTINIPTLGKNIESKQTDFIIKNENDYEWIGQTDEGRGFVIIISSGGQSHIQISTPNYACEIVPVENDIYSLQEFDFIKVNEIGCVTNNDKNDIKKISEQALNQISDQFSKQNSRQDACSEQINPRVLFVYSTPALIYAGSVTEINNIATASIALFNQAINNSGINNNAKIVSAGAVYLSGFTEDSDIEKTLEDLIIDPNVNSLRDTYKADIVVYFCSNNNTDIRGVAGTIDLNSSRAYTVVQIWSSVANKTFAHEVGHLFGCRHDDDDSMMPSYARGYNIKFLLVTVDRTLMARTGSPSQAANRLVHFSNPDVSVSGRSTGTSEFDNARRIDETWSSVSSFRINPPNPPSAIIEGPTYVTSPGHYTFEVAYKCFIAPFSFQWQVSTDGGATYSTVSSTTDTYTHYIGHTQNLHIKCIIGSFYTTHTMVNAVMEEVGARMSSLINSTTQFLEYTNTPIYEYAPIYAYPNPSNRVFKFPYSASENSTVTLKIMSSDGKVYIPVSSLTHNTAGNYEATWDAYKEDAGVYIFQLEIDEKITSGKIILTKDL